MSVLIPRSPALRLAAVFISATALGLLSAWVALHWQDDAATLRLGRLAGWCGTAVLALRAWHDTRPQSWLLCWTGTDWTVCSAAPPACPWTGEVRVRLDLGPWLLLEFVPRSDDAAKQRALQRLLPQRSIWLTADRRQLQAQWHALRCAVYSPRPASAVAPAAGAPTAQPPPHEHRP